MAQICGLRFLNISCFPCRTATVRVNATPPRIGELDTKKFVFGNLHKNDERGKAKKKTKNLHPDDWGGSEILKSQILTSENYPQREILRTLLLRNSGFPHYKKVTVVLANCLVNAGTKKKVIGQLFLAEFSI